MARSLRTFAAGELDNRWRYRTALNTVDNVVHEIRARFLSMLFNEIDRVDRTRGSVTKIGSFHGHWRSNGAINDAAG